jgi:hypothetical protein
MDVLCSIRYGINATQREMTPAQCMKELGQLIILAMSET